MNHMRVAALAAFAILMLSTSAVFADDTFEADANAALKQLYLDTPAAKMIGDKAKAVLVFPNIVKAGFIVGGSAGEGVMTFHGQRYPLSIGGLSYGFTFGASETRFHGTVSNINRPSDVNGVYGQGGAGAAVGRGAQGIVLANQSGAVLTLAGEQTGLIVSADLSGLVLTLK